MSILGSILCGNTGGGGGGGSSYSQAFNNSTDWGSPSGGYYKITISGATHNLGVNIKNVVVSEIDGIYLSPNLTGIAVNSLNGDVEVFIGSVPDNRFAGKVVIIA